MSDYSYPYKDAAFILEQLVDFDGIAAAAVQRQCHEHERKAAINTVVSC